MVNHGLYNAPIKWNQIDVPPTNLCLEVQKNMSFGLVSFYGALNEQISFFFLLKELNWNIIPFWLDFFYRILIRFVLPKI